MLQMLCMQYASPSSLLSPYPILLLLLLMTVFDATSWFEMTHARSAKKKAKWNPIGVKCEIQSMFVLFDNARDYIVLLCSCWLSGNDLDVVIVYRIFW